MDFLGYVSALHRELGIEIPERDFPELRTIAGTIAYLARANSGRN